MALRRLLLAVTAGVLMGVGGVPAPAAPEVSGHPSAGRAGAAQSGVLPADGGVLSLRINTVSPAIEAHEPLTLSGIASNGDDIVWHDVKVYLSIEHEPITSKSGLDDFADIEGSFGTRIVRLGLFDEIGTLSPGERRKWSLSIPYRRLPISGTAGVYGAQVSLLGGTRAGRDEEADAQAVTLVPSLPEQVGQVGQVEQPTPVVTLIPVTAAVLRHPDGMFANDSLAEELSPGGRLRNLLNLIGNAPPGSVQLVVDPALWQAAKDMARGYLVGHYTPPAATGGADPSTDGRDPPAKGQGQQVATSWLADLETATTQQPTALMPWANPDTNALADSAMPGVVDAAVAASRRFAADNDRNFAVVDWQNNGSTTRHALDVARSAGALIHVVSQRSLPRLDLRTFGGFPPDQVVVSTQTEPLSVVVARTDLAGAPFRPDLSAFDFRQQMRADATVRALSLKQPTTSVVAAPFNWNPGPSAARIDLTSLFASPVATASSLSALADEQALRYVGPVQVFSPQPEMSPDVLALGVRLRSIGRTYTQLLTNSEQASAVFDRQLATAGAAMWRWRPHRGEAFISRATRVMARQIAQVSVSGPAFVAMSSNTGRFPLTVSNELDVSVTVRLEVDPRNPALKVSSVAPFTLAAGQRRDVEVRTHVQGSGVTQVQARLSTLSSRRFGASWQFDIRATQIGLAIWLVIGAAGTVLVVAAGRRILRRVRTAGFRPRGEQPQ